MEQIIAEIVEKLSSVGAEYSPVVIETTLRAVAINGFMTIIGSFIGLIICIGIVTWLLKTEWEKRSEFQCVLMACVLVTAGCLGVAAAIGVVYPANWIAAFEPAGWLIMQTLTK